MDGGPFVVLLLVVVQHPPLHKGQRAMVGGRLLRVIICCHVVLCRHVVLCCRGVLCRQWPTVRVSLTSAFLIYIHTHYHMLF
jgi:hypothetical protein